MLLQSIAYIDLLYSLRHMYDFLTMTHKRDNHTLYIFLVFENTLSGN